MHFQGLPLATLLQIGGLGALAITALYLLRQRRRAVPVPSVKLWESVLRDQESTALFSKLRRLLSLLLQLLLLSLLVFALGDPRAEVGHDEGRHIVALVDASASMKAIDVATEDEPTRARIDVAKEALQRIVRGLGRGDRMLIAQMDATVTPLSTLTGDTHELEAAIEKLEAQDTRADLSQALRFASDILKGKASAEVIVVSDGALERPREQGSNALPEVKLSYLPLGKSGRNIAMTALTVRRYPLDRDRYEVMLEVYNGGEEAEDIELYLFGDGEVVDIARLRIEAGERLPRFYSNLSGATRRLEAEVRLADGERDDLPADDRAYALLPDLSRVRVLCVTEGNAYLEAALLLASYLDVTYLAPEDYPPREGQFDITIFDSVTPKAEGESKSVFYIDPSGPHAPVDIGDKDILNVGFDKVDASSPLLRWTSIEDAFIAKARRLGPRTGDQVIGRSLDAGPLLVSGKRGEQRFLALGFDPRESDIVLRAAWPVFMLNAINELAAEDAGFLSSYRTGELWHIPAPIDEGRAWLTSPSGKAHELRVREGRAAFLGREAGFHQLTVEGGDEALGIALAANLADAEESTIKPSEELEIAGIEAGKVEGFIERRREEWWVLLLLAAVLLSAIEWLGYHRRVTV